MDPDTPDIGKPLRNDGCKIRNRSWVRQLALKAKRPVTTDTRISQGMTTAMAATIRGLIWYTFFSIRKIVQVLVSTPMQLEIP